MTRNIKERTRALAYSFILFAAASAGSFGTAEAELIRGEIVEVNEIDGTVTMKSRSSSGPVPHEIKLNVVRVEGENNYVDFHTGDEVLIEAEKKDTSWNLKTLIARPER